MSSSHISPPRKRKRKSEQPNGVEHQGLKKPRQGHTVTTETATDHVQSLERINDAVTETSPPQSHTQKWSTSKPIAGKFIDVDPAFTLDEKFVIFATESSVGVYSTADSSLVHTLPVDDSSTISSYALSSTDNNVLWVSTLQGEILKWSIEDGSLIRRWQMEGSIYTIAASKNPNAESQQEILFMIIKNESWCVQACRPRTSDDGSESMKHVTLHTSTNPLNGLKICHDGAVVVLTTTKSFILGQVFQKQSDKLKKLRYTWREIVSKESPVCFDVRGRSATSTGASNQSSRNTEVPQPYKVDIVIGGIKGCLFVFEDILTSLGNLEKPSLDVETSSPLEGRAMHWHRESVGAVAWSKDGNYIISGGRETVLVLWQMRTSNKQFLPNLESPIQSVVVSPRGSSYAIRLGDNSVMVLPTSELTPTAYIAGLQTLSYSKIVRPAPQLATVENTQPLAKQSLINNLPAVLHPNATNRILAAVPGTQSSRAAISIQAHASYLQDFDLSFQRHEARQAIARNNAISSNLGPEGNRILEPEVKFIQISFNGEWLATVDEWTIPSKDVKKLFAPGDSVDGYRESKLRFWSWDTDAKVWTLNSRIDDPHRLDDAADSGSILHLAASPTSAKFATIGTDATVRVWKSKSKKTPTRPVVDDSKAKDSSTPFFEETWWTVQYQIPLEMSMVTDPLAAINPYKALLTYSQDGSVLAAHLGYEHDFDENALYFIDANQGTVCETKRDIGLDTSEVYGVKFLERYLICLSQDAVTVWDVTNFDIHATYPLLMASSKKLRASRIVPHLEVDHWSSTFAVSVPEKITKESLSLQLPTCLRYRSRLSIYSTQEIQGPVFSTMLPRLTSALLASPVSGSSKSNKQSGGLGRGYIVIDVGAEVRIVSPDSWTGESSYQSLPSAAEPSANAEDGVIINGWHNEEPKKAEDDAVALIPTDDLIKVGNSLESAAETTVDARPVVQKEQLAEVFDYPSQTAPPIKDLFWGVFSLYAEKPVYFESEQAVAAEDSRDSRGSDTGTMQRDDEQSSEASSDSDSSSDSDDSD